MTSVVIIGRGHLGAAAVAVARGCGWDVRRVVTNKVEPAWDRAPTGKVLSEHVPFIWPHIPVDRSGDWRTLIDLDVDVILSVLYDRIIGKELINGPARVLNLHLGKLPEYRGMRPINWALRNGERVAGVTLHEVVAAVDAGPIVAQTTFSIWPEVDDVRDVWRRAQRAGEEILREALPILHRLPAVPQEESKAGYYSARDIPLLGDRQGWTRKES